MYAQESGHFGTPSAFNAPASEPLESLFTAMARGGWSGRLVARRLHEVLAARESLDAAHRLNWLQGLRRCVWHHGWALDATVLEGLLTLAAAWSDWPLAARVGRLMQGRAPLRREQERAVIEALANSGEFDEALELCRRRLLACPWDGAMPRDYGELLARRAEVVADDGEVYLVRLAPRHLAEFAWQYFDPDIAELCNLPAFESGEEWRRWLERVNGEAHEVTLAVMHREWGFVGVVNLFLRRDLGFFYYWIGRDFRGCGLGPRAAGLLLDRAEREWGMRGCIAQALERNHASRAALAKVGFREVDLTVEGGRGKKVIHFRGPEVERSVLRECARQLFLDMDSAEQVVEPWS